MITLGRNDPCHCGSGKKYKKCHLLKDEEIERKRLAKMVVPPVAKEENSSTRPGNSSRANSFEKGKSWFRNLFSRSGPANRPTLQRKSGGGE